ncbi:MAG: hypothetical protein LBK08_04205 [Treponema sp.]|nr:hypothetical protein [Treponema sp.]
MKSKILPLLILLPLILTPASYAQTPPELPGGQNSGYGIEPGTLYPGSAVLEILAAAENEIDAAVEEAYAEGYKAASLRYAPDTAYYAALSEGIKRELAFEKKKTKWFWPSLFIAGGFSFFGGFLTNALVAR